MKNVNDTHRLDLSQGDRIVYRQKETDLDNKTVWRQKHSETKQLQNLGSI